MPRVHVSIRMALAVVATCGLGLAALKSASGYWTSVVLTVTLSVLLASILGAAKGRHRTAWLGFAVFGWGYFAVGLGPWFADDLRPHLLTSSAIADAYGVMHDRRGGAVKFVPIDINASGASLRGRRPLQVGLERAANHPPRFSNIRGMGPVLVTENSSSIIGGGPSYLEFERSAHGLFVLVAGGIGALLALMFESRSERARN